jgi:predicted amidophosphoribosyltransferase
LALRPIWKKQHELSGEWIFGLRSEDLAKVKAGYACSRCLEEFDTYTEECPVCKEPIVPSLGAVERDLFVVVPTPEGW